MAALGRLVVGCLLLCSVSGLAQVVGQHYSLSQPTFNLGDFTTTACAVGGNRSCWKSFSGGPKLIANAYSQWAFTVGNGAEDAIYAIDHSTGSLYKFTLPGYANNYATGSWSIVSGAPAHLSQIAIHTFTYNMYVTTSADELWQFDGTKWIDQNMKAVLISASMGGLLYIETPSFVLKRWGSPSYFGHSAPPPSWITIPYPSGHGYIQGMATGGGDTIWLDMQDGTLLEGDSSGGFYPIPPPAKMNMIYAMSNNPTGAVVLLSDEPVNNVYLFKYSGASHGGTWTRLNGRLDNILLGPDMWGFATDSGYYHFQPKELSVQLTLSGYYQCPLTGCPSGSTHTATASVKWGAGGFDSVVTDSGAPADTLIATAIGQTFDCDNTIDPSDSACQFVLQGTVNCSVMGGIFAASASAGGGGGGGAPPSGDPAETWSKTLNESGNPTTACYQQTNCRNGYPVCYNSSSVPSSIHDGVDECASSYFWKYLWYAAGGNITCFPNAGINDPTWPLALWDEKAPVPPHMCTPRPGQ